MQDIWATVRSIYDTVESVLWAGLIAFVLFFIVMVAPHLTENQARQEAMRLHAEAAEYDAYCEKLGTHIGTREHAVCVLELQEFRADILRQYLSVVGISRDARYTNNVLGSTTSGMTRPIAVSTK